MKRILLLTLLSSATILHGQLIDTLYPDWNGLAGFFSTDTGFLVVTGDAHLHFLNKDGKLIRSKYIEPVNSNLNAVINAFTPFGAQADSFFYFVTFDNHCDYVENFYLNKIDWEGNVVSMSKVEDWYFSRGRIVFPDLPDLPHFIEIVDERVHFHYTNGDELVLELSTHVLESAISQAGNVAILTRDSLFYYEWISGNISLKASNSFDQDLGWQVNLDFVDNNILLSGENKLLLYDRELMPLASVLFEDDEFIWAMNIHEEQIEVMTAIISQRPTLHIYNHSLDLQMEYFPQNMSVHPFGFSFFDSLLTVIGTEFFPVDKAAVAIHQTDFSDTKSSIETDVAITNVHFINASSNEGDCYFEPVRNHYVNGITIKLTNPGERIINDVIITAEKTYCNGFCWYEDRLFYHELTGINLLPGESQEFFIPGAHLQESRSEVNELKCLMAVFPEMRVDADHSNNSFCFDVTTSTDNTKESAIAKNLFYPNPVGDFIYLSVNTPIKSVIVYNANGVKVLEHKMVDESVHIGQLVSGIYLIRAEFSDGDGYTQRFVKL